MITHDPRILTRILGVLEEEVQRFTRTASDTLKQAEHTQSCAQERIRQALRWSAIANYQVESDLEDVHRIEIEASSLLRQYSVAIETSHETVALTGQAQQNAESTLTHWANELQAALAWQARAEARLEKAIRLYQQAQANLESAKSSLSRAESSLQGCRNDPERKNCNSERKTYENAQVAVSIAHEEVQRAEREVHEAQKDLERAKARVRCCQNAVNYAEQAVHHAKLATGHAEQALNDAERSLESAESADRATTNARVEATVAEEQAEQLRIKVNQAEVSTNEAQAYHQTARNMTDSAHRLSSRGMQDLRYRVSQLIIFNQVSSGYRETVKQGNTVGHVTGSFLGGVISAPEDFSEEAEFANQATTNFQEQSTEIEEEAKQLLLRINQDEAFASQVEQTTETEVEEHTELSQLQISDNEAFTNQVEQSSKSEGQAEQLQLKLEEATISIDGEKVNTNSPLSHSIEGSAHLPLNTETQPQVYQDWDSQRSIFDPIPSKLWRKLEKIFVTVEIIVSFFSLAGGIFSTPVPNWKLFGLQNQEDLVLDAGARASSANEDKIRKREEEYDVSERANNEPKVSSPPKP